MRAAQSGRSPGGFHWKDGGPDGDGRIVVRWNKLALETPEHVAQGALYLIHRDRSARGSPAPPAWSGAGGPVRSGRPAVNSEYKSSGTATRRLKRYPAAFGRGVRR